MPRPTSPRPRSFRDRREQDYWHMAQDTAYRLGASLVLENGQTWLARGGELELIVRPVDADRVWYETWLALHRAHPEISRLWVGGRPLK